MTDTLTISKESETANSVGPLGTSALLDKVCNLQIRPSWIKGENSFWYKKETCQGHYYLRVDAASGNQELAFNHHDLAFLLSRVGENDLNPDSLPISALQFQTEEIIVELTSKKLPETELRGTVSGGALLELSKRLYRCDMALTRAVLIDQFPLDALPDDSPCLTSADGLKTVFVRDNNLCLADGDHRSLELTYDGHEHFAYGAWEESFQDTAYTARRRTGSKLPPQGVSWSPCGRYLAAIRTDLRLVPERLILTEYASKNDEFMVPNLRHFPLVTSQQLPIRVVTLIDTHNKTPVTVDIDSSLLQDQSVEHFHWGHIWWSDATDELFIPSANEDGHCYGVLAIDIHSGKSRIVLQETEEHQYIFNNTDIFVDKPAITVTTDGQELVWYSQRSGYGHLYLYDAQSGVLKNQITRGEWVVHQIQYIDEDKRLIYFTAAGRETGRHPHYTHLYRTKFEGGEPELLTPEDAHHFYCGAGNVGPLFADSGEYFVDCFSTVSQAPRYLIRRADGTLVAPLLEADIQPLLDCGWQSPDIVSVKAADNTTDLYGVIYKPLIESPNSAYPIIEYTYPGPQGSYAPKGFVDGLTMGGFVDRAMIEQQQVAVVIIDGRGTAGRDRAFRYAFLGTEDVFGAADHKAALENLAAQDSTLDINRVGVVGISYGGYGSARAALLFPEFYKVCVSMVGSHDYRYSGNPGIKRMFGVPGEKGRDSLELVSNTRLAGRLIGKMLLIYGELDLHVRLNQCFLMVDAFINADKDVDMMIVPNADHLVGKLDYVKRKWQQYFSDHL